MCFPPLTVDVAWTITVVAEGGRGAREHADVFGPIAFGTGAPPPAPATPPPRRATPARCRQHLGRPNSSLARFDEFEIRGATAAT